MNNEANLQISNFGFFVCVLKWLCSNELRVYFSSRLKSWFGDASTKKKSNNTIMKWNETKYKLFGRKTSNNSNNKLNATADRVCLINKKWDLLISPRTNGSNGSNGSNVEVYGTHEKCRQLTKTNEWTNERPNVGKNRLN